MPHKTLVKSSLNLVICRHCFRAIICSAKAIQQSIGHYIHVFGEHARISLAHTHTHIEIQFNLGV